MTLPRDWSEFFACFLAHEVDFVVVGGHAVAFHGFPRFTRDIDLLTSVSGLDDADASHRSVPGTLGDVDVRFVSLDDLRMNKRAAGRPRDLADLADLGG